MNDKGMPRLLHCPGASPRCSQLYPLKAVPAALSRTPRPTALTHPSSARAPSCTCLSFTRTPLQRPTDPLPCSRTGRLGSLRLSARHAHLSLRVSTHAARVLSSHPGPSRSYRRLTPGQGEHSVLAPPHQSLSDNMAGAQAHAWRRGALWTGRGVRDEAATSPFLMTALALALTVAMAQLLVPAWASRPVSTALLLPPPPWTSPPRLAGASPPPPALTPPGGSGGALHAPTAGGRGASSTPPRPA